MDPMPLASSKIRLDRSPLPKTTEESNDIQDLLTSFIMEPDWIMGPTMHLVEKYSGIIAPTLGFTLVSAYR